MAGGTVALLLTWMGLWMGLGPGGSVPVAAAIALAWLPLLPALPGLFRGGRKAAGWCSLVGVFYAGFAVMELLANPASRTWAAVALALSVVMISSQLRLIRSRPGPGGAPRE